MSEKKMEPKNEIAQAIEKAYKLGVRAGGVAIAQQIINKLNEHKRNLAVGAQKVLRFCNAVIQYKDYVETEQEETHEASTNDI